MKTVKERHELEYSMYSAKKSWCPKCVKHFYENEEYHILFEKIPDYHELKTLPHFFSDLSSRKKNFEVRKNDRDFEIGDILILKEYDPEKGFTGKELKRKIDYILKGGQFGIDKDYCVLGISVFIM